MRLTPGERRALFCYAAVFIGFMPPVIIWVASYQITILGLPFILLWNALMVIATAILLNLASFIKNRSDKK